jgi:hypothetical protein
VARTIRTATIDRQEAALARLSQQAQAADVLLDRLISRPDPDPEIQQANLQELVTILLAAYDIRLLLISDRIEI